MRWLGLVCVALSIVASCGSKDDDNDGDSRCVPGEVNTCPGPSGCEGAQTCSDDGTYGECVCVDGPNGGAGAPGHAGAGSDTGGAAETGGTSGSGGAGGAPSVGGTGATGAIPACDPEDVSAFEPSAYIPARQTPGACTEAEIERYHDECLMTGSCDPFRSGGESAACGTCLWPSTTDESSRGPLLVFTVDNIDQWVTNSAGCVELMGEAACAEKIQTAWQCTHQACSVCPASIYGSTQAYEDCTRDARAGDCAEYDAAARCITGADALATCGGGSFREMVIRFGMAFCG